MEIFQIQDNNKSIGSRTVKSVPILTDQMMATILHIPSNTNLPPHSHAGSDEIHYIVSGAGKIKSGNHGENVKKGMLIMVPRAEVHNISTFECQMVVLSFVFVSGPPKHPLKKND